MVDSAQWKHSNAIVECDWLKDHIDDQSIRIYDCSTYLHYTDDHPSKPYDVVSGLTEYKKEHIPKSAYLDIQSDLSNTDSPYSFTLPKLSHLAYCLKQLGIGDPHHIILYSRNGVQWATRIWWMIYVLGYKKVSILNGGFSEWKRLGMPTEQTLTCFPAADFDSGDKPEIFVGREHVLASIYDDKSVLINALTADIHWGHSKRYGRPGHITSSLNIPFHTLVEPDSGKFVSPKTALKIFQDQNISSNLKIINYCGGGIAASLNAFILYQLGFENIFIYDNSLSEWAMDPSLPMEIC